MYLYLLFTLWYQSFYRFTLSILSKLLYCRSLAQRTKFPLSSTLVFSDDVTLLAACLVSENHNDRTFGHSSEGLIKWVVAHSPAIKLQSVNHISVTNFIKVTTDLLYSGGVNGSEAVRPKMKVVITALEIADKWWRRPPFQYDINTLQTVLSCASGHSLK